MTQIQKRHDLSARKVTKLDFTKYFKSAKVFGLEPELSLMVLFLPN